jgi:hypothetical protein
VSRLPFADPPPETRFFLLIAGWAGVLGAIYWIVSGEVAGTALLAGLALATGAMSFWLIRGRRRRGGHRTGDADRGVEPGVDRPFLDEDARLPDASLAPFAVGLGIALAALGPVFGIAPVAVGAVALLWGAGRWFGAARDELDAQDRGEATGGHQEPG